MTGASSVVLVEVIDPMATETKTWRWYGTWARTPRQHAARGDHRTTHRDRGGTWRGREFIGTVSDAEDAPPALDVRWLTDTIGELGSTRRTRPAMGRSQ